jgi:hypothetical protein
MPFAQKDSQGAADWRRDCEAPEVMGSATLLLLNR